MNKATPENESGLLPRLHAWASEEIFFSGDEYFNDLINGLKHAKTSIEIECYIFYQDSLGKKIIAALIEAAKKGVEIHLIIDGHGSLNWNRQQLLKLKDIGIKVKIFHPLPWRLSLYSKSTRPKNFINKFIYLASRINKRDHRKLYIVDKIYAWSGSLNISDSHLKQSNANCEWFDCGVKVTGESVLELSDNFHGIFKRKIHYPNENPRLPFRTNNNIIRRQHKNNEFVRLIQTCKQRVWIISAYFAPSRKIVNALKQARLNNVNVKLIISRHSDVIFFPLISTTYFAELLEADIEIYIHNKYLIHAKTVLIDNIAFVGSSNLNHRSFLHDLELDTILSHKKSLQKLVNESIQLINDSDKINLSKLTKLPWYYRIMGKIIWRIRYWL
ncbi:MAG: phospholipase D-like domain-containing protein [Gammaproteobacteria bacterium]|nr:phospholipase D-like domain-containing protein [Gammaproteobacteria bacterium]